MQVQITARSVNTVTFMSYTPERIRSIAELASPNVLGERLPLGLPPPMALTYSSIHSAT